MWWHDYGRLAGKGANERIGAVTVSYKLPWRITDHLPIIAPVAERKTLT